MRKLPLKDFCETYGKTIDAINANASIYKRNNGEYPSWYIHEGRRVFIDVDCIEMANKTEHEAWLENTDPENGTYWTLSIMFGLNDAEIARMVCDKATHYTSLSSWVGFIRNNMFNSPRLNKIQEKITMNIEFNSVSKQLIKELQIKIESVKDFRKVDDLFDYYEALEILERMRKCSAIHSMT